MKLKFLFFSVLVLSAITLSSCGDDDEKAPAATVSYVEIEYDFDDISQDLLDIADITVSYTGSTGNVTETITSRDWEKKVKITTFPSVITYIVQITQKSGYTKKDNYNIQYAWSIDGDYYKSDGSDKDLFNGENTIWEKNANQKFVDNLFNENIVVNKSYTLTLNGDKTSVGVVENN